MKEESIAFFIVMILVWGVTGLFVAFVCNGGAAGSSEMSSGAWVCLVIYTLIFSIISFVMHNSFQPADESINKGIGSDSFECDEPFERDVDFIKIIDQNIDYSDKYDIKKVLSIVIMIIVTILGYMMWNY